MIPTGPTGEIHTLKFSKENNSVLPMISPDVDSTQPSGSDYRVRPLRILPDISGLSAVFMPGASAGFVLRTSASAPHFLRLRGESPRCVSSLDTSECSRGFIFMDSQVRNVRIIRYIDMLT